MHGIRCSICGFFSWASPKVCECCGEPLPEIKRAEPIGTYSKAFREATPVILETYKPPEQKLQTKPVSENISSNGSSNSNYETESQDAPTVYIPSAMRTDSGFKFETQNQSPEPQAEEEKLIPEPDVKEKQEPQDVQESEDPIEEKGAKEDSVSTQESESTDDAAPIDELEEKKKRNLAKYHRKVDYKLINFTFKQKKDTAVAALVMGAINVFLSLYLSTQQFENLVSSIIDVNYFQIAFCGWIGLGSVVSFAAYWKAKTSNSYSGAKPALIGLVLSIIALLLMLFVTAKLIPKLIDSYKEPNEILAYRSIRQLHDAEKEYKKRTGEFGIMQELSAQGLVDRELAKETKDGYSFAIKAGREICEIFATPINKSSNEMSYYISLKDGVVHGARKDGEQANADDPVVTDANLNLPHPPNKPANTNQNTSPPVVTIPPATTTNTNQSGLEESINVTREVAVIASIKMLYTSEITYQASTGAGKFGTLQQLHETGLIDAQFAAGKKHEYIFSVKLVKDVCEIYATPINPKKTKKSFFLSSIDGVIRFAERNGKPATFKDQPIGK